MEKMEVKELKVAKRGREHVVFTGRRRMGLADVRHCLRVLRGGLEATRRDVTDLRRDIANYGAQIGVIVSAGDVGREARAEATAAGQLPVVLLCGEALAEAMTEAGVGCRPVVVPEIDEDFFRAAAETAAEEEAARRTRREERERREDQDRRERRERRDEGRASEPVEVVAAEGSGEATVDPAPDPGAGEEPAIPTVTVAGTAEPAEAADEGDEGDDGDEGPEAPAAEGQSPTPGAGQPREGGRRRW
jgi:hypothetical protein